MSNFNLRNSWTTWKWDRAFQFGGGGGITSSSNIFSLPSGKQQPPKPFCVDSNDFTFVSGLVWPANPRSITHEVLFLSFYFFISFKNAVSSFCNLKYPTGAITVFAVVFLRSPDRKCRIHLTLTQVTSCCQKTVSKCGGNQLSLSEEGKITKVLKRVNKVCSVSCFLWG